MPLPYPSFSNIAGYMCLYRLPKPSMSHAEYKRTVTNYFANNVVGEKEASSLTAVKYAILECTKPDADNVQQNIENLKVCLKKCASEFKNTELGRVYNQAYASLMSGTFFPAQRAATRATSRLSQ